MEIQRIDILKAVRVELRAGLLSTLFLSLGELQESKYSIKWEKQVCYLQRRG
jgi:hypothetical protein